MTTKYVREKVYRVKVYMNYEENKLILEAVKVKKTK
jgi:hypothetical protein